MATIRVCDLCGKRITEDDEAEQYSVVVKKYFNKWIDIDMHKACREKMFDVAKNVMSAPTGGSSMQER